MAFGNFITWGRGNQQQPNQQSNQQQPSNQQQGPAPMNNQQQNQQQNQPSNGNGSGGPAGKMDQPANGNVGTDPMMPFLDMMTMKPQLGPDGKPVQQVNPNDQSLFGQVDPKAIEQQISQVSFTQGIDPASIQKALSGDGQELMNILEHVGRSAFKNSFEMSRGMVEHGVRTGNERFTSTLDSHFRDYDLRNQTIEASELNDPFSKMLITGLSKQIAQANPKLGAKEVHAQAVKAVQTYRGQGGNNQGQNTEQPAEKDWLASLGIEGN